MPPPTHLEPHDPRHADDGSTTSLLIREFRVPRTLIAIMVGIALGLAGAVIQAITRNPLADPGILGVNAGAYTAVVIAAAFLGSSRAGRRRARRSRGRPTARTRGTRRR